MAEIDTKMGFDGKEVVDGMKSIEKAVSNVSKTVEVLVGHFEKLEKLDLSKFKDSFSSIKSVTSGKGSMLSTSGREKNFKLYQQAAIEEVNSQKELNEELKKDAAERRRRRKERAAAETQRAQNEAVRASKAEDRNSSAFIADRRMIAEAKLLNAKNNQVGAQYKNPRFQAARALDTIGDKVSSIGVGSDKIEGKAVGNVLSTVGAFLKSPWAGTATAIAKLTESIIDLSKSAIESYSEIEATKTQLGVVFSNQTQADAMFGQISQYAVKSPFGIQQTSELAVLLKQSGVYASDLMDTLKMLGDTAGGNMEKMKRIANNYAQIMAIGKASMLDMRQFAYAGIPIFEAVSKELNVSQQELRKLISDGKVTSDIIEKVFKDLTGINGIFENATEKGAKTLKARLQNLADAKQLAMASIGEFGVKYGEQTGNDSYINRIVTGIENIYQWIQQHMNTVNIEKSVQTIENRENREKQLEELKEYIKNSNDPNKATLLKAVDNQLTVERNKKDIDKDRAAYTNFYDTKANAWIKAVEEGETRTLSELSSELAKVNAEILKYQNIVSGTAYNNPVNKYAVGGYGGYSANETVEGIDKRNAQAMVIALQEEAKVLNEHIYALKEYRDVTVKSLEYRKESNLLEAQKLAIDTANKNGKATDSLTSQFQELSSLFKNSDEEKRKQEEERLKILKDAQKTLNELKKHSDKNGRINLSSMSLKEALYYQKNGAFTANSINLNPKTNADMASSRQQLEENLSWFINIFSEEIKKQSFWHEGDTTQGSVTRDSILNHYSKLSSGMSNEQWLRTFNKDIFDSISKSLDNLGKRDKNATDFVNQMKTALGLVTTILSADFSGTNANPNDTLNGKIGIPLWKRILSASTGLTTQGMTGTNQTMENYRDDMAIRNMASGVLKATFSSMGPEVARELIRTTGEAKVLRNDKGGNPVYQVDWKETKKAIHDFATQLSASTEVIDAYKAGLEAELNAYNELFAAGFTEGETADFTKQKTISTKQLEKVAQDAGDQLVNAFAEKLTTEDGRTVYYNKASKQFEDEKGNKIQEEQLRVSGKLFEFIKGGMPRLRKEISEATLSSLNAGILSTLYKSSANSLINTQAVKYHGFDDTNNFIRNNPEYSLTAFNSKLDEKKIGTSYEGKRNDEILFAAQKNEKEAVNLIQEVFHEIEYFIKELVNSSSYKELKSTELLSSRSADNRIAELENKARGNRTDWSPEKDSGKRGFQNRMADWLGVARDYDMTSLMSGMALRGDMTTKNYSMLPGRREELQQAYDTTFETKQTEYEGQGMDGATAAAQARLDAEQKVVDMMSEEERHAAVLEDSYERMGESIRNMGNSIGKSLASAGKGAFLAPFETLGECLMGSDDAAKDLESKMKDIAADLLKQIGSAMALAGFEIAGAAALTQNWGMVAAGLALAAAGGIVSGIGGALGKKDDNDNKAQKEIDKLDSIKDALADLLKQAREDAWYYETTLRHRKALATNNAVSGSYTSVNDAIITPQGKIISTHPDDYLIATKTPQTLVRAGGSPTVNFNIIDKSSGVKVTQQKIKYNEDTNTIDFEAMIENKVGEYIASSKSDEAFSARQSRLQGRSVIA